MTKTMEHFKEMQISNLGKVVGGHTVENQNTGEQGTTSADNVQTTYYHDPNGDGCDDIENAEKNDGYGGGWCDDRQIPWTPNWVGVILNDGTFTVKCVMP